MADDDEVARIRIPDHLTASPAERAAWLEAALRRAWAAGARIACVASGGVTVTVERPPPGAGMR